MRTVPVQVTGRTKASFVTGISLFATVIVFVAFDISRYGIQIFPTPAQVEHGRKVDAIFCSLLGLAFLVELMCLCFFVADNTPPRRVSKMQERL